MSVIAFPAIQLCISMNKTLILVGGILLVFVFLFLSFDSFGISKKLNPDVNKFRALSLQEQVEYLDQASEKLSIPELRDFIKLAYPGEPNDKHELSHKLGELAIEKEGIAGFGSCDSLLQFGCFHGAALTAVKLKGNDPELASKLWQGCKSKAKLPGICLHGLGHAITMIKEYELLPAYEECERVLAGEEDAFWCQDGVSMENISRSMAPSSLGEYGRKDDPYYPCNSIPKRFETPCVRNHIGYLYRSWGGNLQRSFDFCPSYGAGKTAEECVNIIGSIIASDYINDPEKLVSQCRTAGSYHRFCIEGAVTNYSMARQFDRAEKLCHTLEENRRESCFKRIESFQFLK